MNVGAGDERLSRTGNHDGIDAFVFSAPPDGLVEGIPDGWCERVDRRIVDCQQRNAIPNL
jgi:hypothetical protein